METQKDLQRLAIVVSEPDSPAESLCTGRNLAQLLGPGRETHLLSIRSGPSAPPRGEGLPDSGILGCIGCSGNRWRRLIERAQVALRLRRYVITHGLQMVLLVELDVLALATLALALPGGVVRVAYGGGTGAEISPMHRGIARLAHWRLDAFVWASGGQRPILFDRSPKSFVIPPAARDAVPASPDSRDSIILCAGDRIANMGVERLLWLLRVPLQTYRDWRVVCVTREEHGKTDWDHLEYLVGLLRALRIEGRLILSQTQGQTNDWYQRASIYAIGASQPGAAKALIDAKAYGLPVLGYDQACILTDLVNHQIDGYLIEDEDSAVAAMAARLIEDQELRERMGKASRADANARFSPKAVGQQWRELIESLVLRRAMDDSSLSTDSNCSEASSGPAQPLL